ncbi:N-acetylglucosamine-6-phosphate deacetylase [Allonocardiopsis opalescens]|uniref:N-acetylglucosamine-6-phosphate deacetylase n=1 Tax=Allonocardiopsis opalescens TaxID=1144618 RepID=A0A2T0Q333_9ACTN|nr:amidohydrolase family protein [Allonocardiopsis opalescens]PRX98130.1 N-acetylglucosamine-6-phosphate deacetylase [Allonocardiopsis opalescens]
MGTGAGPLRLAGGRVLLPDGRLTQRDLVLDGGTVHAVLPPGAPAPPLGAERARREGPGEATPADLDGTGGPAETRWDVSGQVVAPGFIDTHVHGALGHSFMAPDPDGLAAIGGHLARHGVTACVATTVSAAPDALAAAVRGLAAAGGRLGGCGVHLLGLHLEGPFISPQARGVHPAERLRTATAAEIHRLHAAAGGALRTVTLAPELPGGAEAVAVLAELGVSASLGHSTAGYEQARRAFDAGVRRVTHCFNALPPIDRHAPGAVTAALVDERVRVEVIADGRHVAAPLLRFLHDAVGPDRMMAVSDGSDVSGLPDGAHRRWEGTEVSVRGGEITAAGGGPAGGGRALDHAVATLVGAGVPLAAALRTASATPAAQLGAAAKGRIAPGADADLVVLDPDLSVAATVIGGRIVYRR